MVQHAVIRLTKNQFDSIELTFIPLNRPQYLA